MKETKKYGTVINGRVIDVKTGADITDMFRQVMIDHAIREKQGLVYDSETDRARRIDMDELPDHGTEVKKPAMTTADPILSLIHKASEIKPADLEMSDIKWKYLVRSAVRGKNIMMVGPAGCGKTAAAKALPVATNRPFFYFNLGATQDPRATLIVTLTSRMEKPHLTNLLS
jgi:hypothetical protein